MTTDQACADGHEWRQFGREEMTAFRSGIRQGRPPGAWVEAVNECQRCRSVEVTISWFGQVEKVPYAPREEGGAAVIHWPPR